MNRRRTGLVKAAMSALHYSGAGRLLTPLTAGVGVIFTLHRVTPVRKEGFRPNDILEVQPDFLENTIELVKARGFDIVSLDDAHARLAEGDFDTPFACFTFDDGYRDNREYAYPIFRRHGVPFAIYVPSDFADGNGDLWWLTLERVIEECDAIELRIRGVRRRFDLATVALKEAAFEEIYWWIRGIPEHEARSIVNELALANGIDVSGQCRSLIMDWNEIRDLASDPLVTIGAHTRRHLALAKLTRAEATLEMAESVQRLESELGRRIRHFSYPYGDRSSAGEREFELARELGFKTAVTTRKGLLHEQHSNRLTALPRVSLNGNFQHSSYVKVLLSGAPFAFLNVAKSLPFPRQQAA